MDVWEAIRQRNSIRVFRSNAVSEKTIEKIVASASEAPSSSNMQPWEYVVVTGHAKTKLAEKLVALFKEEGKDYDFEGDKGKLFPPEILARRRKFYDELFARVSEQKVNPKEFLQEGTYNFYNAPVVVFVFIDASMDTRFYFDIGASVQNILLAAQAEGLGTHIIRLVVRFEEAIKEFLNMPGDKELVVGICVGYADPTAAINKYKPERVELEEIVRWIKSV